MRGEGVGVRELLGGVFGGLVEVIDYLGVLGAWEFFAHCCGAGDRGARLVMLVFMF